MQTKIIEPVDFETYGIEQRPKYPPEPVGVALKIDGKDEYLAWGHPENNNIKKGEAKKILVKKYKEIIPVFHNSEFDIDVGSTHLGLPMPKEFHDTLFLAYLYDPRSVTLSLKPLADMHLDLPAEEQDELKAWILNNIEGAHDSKTSKYPHLYWGGLMHLAPVEIVGRYAKGDILRTEGLFNFYMPYIAEHGMLEAYEREKQVMPIFMDMSKKGIRVNKTKLVKDKKQFEKEIAGYEKKIIKRLKAPKDILITSGVQLANAMDEAGVVDHWFKTAKGNRSTARDNLVLGCNDKKLLDLLKMHSTLSKYVSTFIKNWITPDGRIYPNFNQVRTPDEHGKVFGTRTGRPSSNNPNFLNVPRNVEDKRLPNLRDYILPDVGCSLLLRDYSQQEFRILGHYEQGALFKAYNDEPTTDAHKLLQLLIFEIMHRWFERHPVKTVNFGKIYGMGKPAVAKKTGGTLIEAADLIKAHAKAFPDVINLDKAIKKHAKAGNPIYTWGGREYYVEEDSVIQGRKRTWEYKMLNYLIQGSAADVTKEAMIRVAIALSKMKLKNCRIVLQVYDEIVVNVIKGKEKEAMIEIRDAMESINLDVPLLSDGKIGKVSWGGAKKVKY